MFIPKLLIDSNEFCIAVFITRCAIVHRISIVTATDQSGLVSYFFTNITNLKKKS